jgi:phosphatidylglycerophosphatase A
MPGTFASVVASLFSSCYFYLIGDVTALSWGVFLVILLLLLLGGLWSCHTYLRLNKQLGDDPSSIVIDEVLGQAIIFAWCFAPFSLGNEKFLHVVRDLCQQNKLHVFCLVAVVNLVLFRFFDITKLGPIGWADKKIKGPLGIMLDDILAALASVMLLVLVNIMLNVTSTKA